VTNNRLTALDEYAFDALPRRLELLSFDKNMLSSSKMPRFIVPPALQQAAHSKLRFLYLSDCNLRGTLDLTYIGAKFPLLDTFHAGGNNLDRLAPSNALSSAVLPPRIRYVDLSNNPQMKLQS
jgi:hypothetical protein